MPSYFPVAHLLSWEIADPGTVGIFQWPLPESPNEIAPVLNRTQKKYILRRPTSGWHGALCPAGWLIAWHRVVPQMVRDRREGAGAGGRGLIVCHQHTPHPPVIAKTTTTITLSLLFVLDDLSLVPGAHFPANVLPRRWIMVGSLKMCQLESSTKIFDDGNPNPPTIWHWAPIESCKHFSNNSW